MNERSLQRMLGEFAVIVVGVLTALALEGAWQQWQDASSEDRYLMELRAEAERNASELDSYLQTTDSLLEALEAAVAAIHVGEVEGSDEAVTRALIGASQQSGIASRVSRAVFEDLVNTGNLRLIGEPELRREVTEAYSRYESSLARMELTASRIDSRLLSVVSAYVPTGRVSGTDAADVLRSLASDPDFRSEANREIRRLYSVMYYMGQAQVSFANLYEILEGRG